MNSALFLGCKTDEKGRSDPNLTSVQFVQPFAHDRRLTGAGIYSSEDTGNIPKGPELLNNEGINLLKKTKPKQPPLFRLNTWAYSETNIHTNTLVQLMQLSNFYCNWKTIHHRNFMVGFGKVLFTIIIDEIVCLWQYDYTSRKCKMQVCL